MNLNEMLSTEVFGVSIRWIVIFIIKGFLIYVFVRVLNAFIKYLFNRSQRKRGRIVFDETKSASYARLLQLLYI